MQFSVRRHLADRELSRGRLFGSAPLHIRSGPVGAGASSGDVDLNGHSQIVGRETGPSAVQRYRLAWIAHHRDTHEAVLAVASVVRNMQGSGDEACGHPK